jgi:hypothetical protein
MRNTQTLHLINEGVHVRLDPLARWRPLHETWDSFKYLGMRDHVVRAMCERLNVLGRATSITFSAFDLATGRCAQRAKRGSRYS